MCTSWCCEVKLTELPPYLLREQPDLKEEIMSEKPRQGNDTAEVITVYDRENNELVFLVRTARKGLTKFEAKEIGRVNLFDLAEITKRMES